MQMKFQLVCILVFFNFIHFGQSLLKPTSYDLASIIGLTTD